MQPHLQPARGAIASLCSWRHSAVAGAALAAVVAVSAQAAPLFAPGSTFQVQAFNSPNTFTDNVSLTPGTTLLGGGQLSLTISIVPDGLNEWLVFTYNTAGGGPLSQQNQNWEIEQVGLNAAVAVNFIAAFVAFTEDGTALTPTSTIFGGDIRANPVPGGTGIGFGGSGFVAPFGPGPLPALGAFIRPWSFLNATGIDSTRVNGFMQALEFAPQVVVPIPEPRVVE